MKTKHRKRVSALHIEQLESRHLLTAAPLNLELVSTGAPGDTAAQVGNDNSLRPALSANGRYVAFNSSADNFVSKDTNGVTDVFVKDMWTGTLKLVSG